MPSGEREPAAILALRWIASRLREGMTPDRAWDAVVAFGLTDDPAKAHEAYAAGLPEAAPASSGPAGTVSREYDGDEVERVAKSLNDDWAAGTQGARWHELSWAERTHWRGLAAVHLGMAPAPAVSHLDALRELLLGTAHHLRNLPVTPVSDDIRWAERLEAAARGDLLREPLRSDEAVEASPTTPERSPRGIRS